MRVYLLMRQVDFGDRVEAVYFDEKEARDTCDENNAVSQDSWYVEDHNVRGYRSR